MKIATFSERLAEAMRIRKVSQTELHNRTGINKSSISTYLKGEYEAKQNKVYEIARALNVSEAWLMGYDVAMNDTSKTDAPAAPLPNGNTPLPKGSATLSQDESLILSKYRRLSPDGKEYIHDQLNFRLDKEAADEKKETHTA